MLGLKKASKFDLFLTISTPKSLFLNIFQKCLQIWIPSTLFTPFWYPTLQMWRKKIILYMCWPSLSCKTSTLKLHNYWNKAVRLHLGSNNGLISINFLKCTVGCHSEIFPRISNISQFKTTAVQQKKGTDIKALWIQQVFFYFIGMQCSTQ